MIEEIGVIGPAAEDDFAANIAAGLRSLGISAHCLGPTHPRWLGGRALAVAAVARHNPRVGRLMERSIISSIRERGLKHVITVTSLDPQTVETLTQQGVGVVLWFPDAVSNLGTLRMFDAPYAGLFFKEPWLVRQINALLAAPVHYLPEACNPEIHRPIDSTVADGKVVVVGNLHAARARLLERLIGDDIPLSIYGNPKHQQRYPSLAPFHTGRYVRGLAKAAVFRSAAAVLNNLHPAEIEGMNCRLFEAAAAGGTVVTEVRSELPKLFRPDKEVLTFTSYDTLLEQLVSTLDGSVAGRQLGDAASARALRDHTYEVRLREMLEFVV